MQGKNMYYAVKGTIRLDFDWLVVLVIYRLRLGHQPLTMIPKNFFV